MLSLLPNASQAKKPEFQSRCVCLQISLRDAKLPIEERGEMYGEIVS